MSCDQLYCQGYESEAFYPNTKFVFKGIENIHIMRESLRYSFTHIYKMEVYLSMIFPVSLLRLVS